MAELTIFEDAGNIPGMRLNSAQSQAIREAVHQRDPAARIDLFVWLAGR